MEAVRYCLDYPGVDVIILRRTMPDLKRTVIDKFKTQVPKWWYEKGSQELGTLNESDHICYWPPNPETGLQSKLWFGAIEKESQMGKFLSTEYAFIGFEELGEFPFLVFDAMVGRNRTPIPNVRCTVGAATNPMGIGWGWIKRLWVDKLPVRGMDPEKYDAADYEYFHSTVDQNPIYSETEQGREYIKLLEASPNRDRIRWGKLDAVSGQYFANWDPARHIVGGPQSHYQKSDFVFNSWRPYWMGWDYGFGHYAVITFWTKALRNPRFEGDKPKVVNITIAELVLQEKTPEEQAMAVLQKIPRTYDEHGTETGYQWNIDQIHLSWERFNKSTKDKYGNIISIADMIGDLFAEHGLPRPSRSNTDRVSGWTKMYSMLEMDEWYVMNDCSEVINSIPLAVRGNGIECSIEDVVKPPGLSLEDDVNDSLRYAVAGSLLGEGEKPREEEMREEMEKIKDPIKRAALMYKDHIKQTREAVRGPRQPQIPAWVNRVRPRE